MTMHRQESRLTWLVVILMALAGATMITAPLARADSKIIVGVSRSGARPHVGMHPRMPFHPGFGLALPREFDVLSPPGSGIVPPIGPVIVPPLVSGPARFDRGSFRHLAFSPFEFGRGSGIFIDGIPESGGLFPQTTAPPRLPPPQPDFQPHIITFKPDATVAGDPRSVVILRPGQPDEVKRFGDGAH
jgi:hypothetical protein